MVLSPEQTGAGIAHSCRVTTAHANTAALAGVGHSGCLRVCFVAFTAAHVRFLKTNTQLPKMRTGSEQWPGQHSELRETT